MIISEEKDYFIYGCLTTIFFESLLCMFYGYCCENRCNKYIVQGFYPRSSLNLHRNKLITKNDDDQFDNFGSSLPTESFIDL